MMAYKKHVWGVMREWKRAKRAPLEFEEDYQTTLQVRDLSVEWSSFTESVQLIQP
eukprot:SAG31_NODE_2265_length_6057_cov_1.956193_5_plen_55_part_00